MCPMSSTTKSKTAAPAAPAPATPIADAQRDRRRLLPEWQLTRSDLRVAGTLRNCGPLDFDALFRRSYLIRSRLQDALHKLEVHGHIKRLDAEGVRWEATP